MIKLDIIKYEDYRIIFSSLFNYLFSCLKHSNEENAKNVYRIIYMRCPEIFLKNKFDKNRKMFDFKHIFLEQNLRKIISLAIENKHIDFLRSLDLFDDLFRWRDNETNYYELWSDNVRDVFIENKFEIIQKSKFLLDNNISLLFIEDDFKIFIDFSNIPIWILKTEWYKELLNHIINTLAVIYEYAISINYSFSFSDFELLWMSCLDLNDSHKDMLNYFILFWRFFTCEFDKICEIEYKKAAPDEQKIYNVLGRILQIKESTEDESFLNGINSTYDILTQKYPKIIKLAEIKPVFRHIQDTDYSDFFKIHL